MGTLKPLHVLEQGQWLNRLRLRPRSGTRKPRWLATAHSLTGFRSHRRRLSSTQQKAGEDDAAPEPVLHYYDHFHPSSQMNVIKAPAE